MKTKLFISIFLTSFITLKSQDQNISNGNVFEGEPYIAINPSNPKNIVVAWMGFVFNNGSGLTIKVKSSFNGGLSWNTTVNMPHIVPTYKSADPSMAFDNNGNLFLSYIDYRENPDSGGVYLFKSMNGGLSWGAPVKMIDMYADGNKLPIDRPWLVVNNTGDKLYLTTKPAPWIPAPNRPYFVTSADSGATWQPWRYLDTVNYLVGNLIAAPMPAPCGYGNTFHAMYPSYVTSQNVYPQYILASSTNNGAHFTYRTFTNTQTPAANDSAKLAYRLIQDPTNSNHLVFVYPSKPYGDIDIMMIETNNSGTSWTAPLRINDDPQSNNKMQDMLWADFDTDGDLIITWRDRRNSPGNGFARASEFYATFRDHDSLNFSANFILSDMLVPYDDILSESGNDFMSTVLRDDTLYSVYANTKDGSLDVWFVKSFARTGAPTSIFQLETKPPGLFVTPNPSYGIFNISLKRNQLLKEIIVHNQKGDIILSETHNDQAIVLDLRNQPNGIYTITIKTNDSVSTHKVVILK
ncbi:MAG: T9SS type A sorting domain-containing protein [Bacteroidia bacterium]|jgi:hypothetical protein